MSICSKDVQEEIKMNGDGGGRNVDPIVTTSRDNSSSYPYLFDRDIVVHSLGGKDSNLFTSFITNNWSVGDAPNGGYLMSIAIAAAQRTTKFKDPLSVSAYYTSKSVENESLDIEVTTLSTSRSSSVIQIGFKQLGILRCQFIGTFGDFTSLKGVDYGALIAPQLPPIEKCINSSEIILKALGGMNSLSKNICFLSPPDDPLVVGCLHGRREDVSSASISCWVRFEDGRLPCVLSSSFFLDALPPPILSAVSSNWVPTFEYNVHFWSRPINELPTDKDHTTTSCTADGSVRWLRCRFHTPFVLRGMLYTDGELWDEEGKTLLATSRQLARVLTNIKN
jgi:acyl-CoA thioesterase